MLAQMIRAGHAVSWTGCWGDYSATTIDPSNDWNFWTVQQVAATDVDTWTTVRTVLRPEPQPLFPLRKLKEVMRVPTQEVFWVCYALLTSGAFSQGYFTFSNLTAPTRVGSANGPLAEPGIWGQALVGTNSSSLAPIGPPTEHIFDGLIRSRLEEVPLSPLDFPTVYVQMAAWDGTRWGTDYSDVPLSQMGFTDIVPVALSFSWQPYHRSLFTLPAIVPIPEPTIVGLLGLATLALLRWGKLRGGKPARR